MHLIKGKTNSSNISKLVFFSLCQSWTKSYNKHQLGYYIPQSLRICACMCGGVYVCAWEWERGIERVDTWNDCQENKAKGGWVSRSSLFLGMWSTEKSCLGSRGEGPGMNQQECDLIFPLSHILRKKQSRYERFSATFEALFLKKKKKCNARCKWHFVNGLHMMFTIRFIFCRPSLHTKAIL